MDIRLYTRSKMAADSRSISADRAPGTDFSQIFTHSVSGQGRQGESDKYKERAHDVTLQKFKHNPHDHYAPVAVKDLPLEAARQFYQARLQFGVPVAPEALNFDEQGNLLLPADYPYASQLKQAFNSVPDLREKILNHSAHTGTFSDIQSKIPVVESHNENDGARARFEQMVMMSGIKRSI